MSAPWVAVDCCSPVWVVSLIVCEPRWALIGSWPMTCDLITCSMVTGIWELAWCINSGHTPQSGVVAVWEISSSEVGYHLNSPGYGKQEGLGLRDFSCLCIRATQVKELSTSHVWLLLRTSLLAVLPASWSAQPIYSLEAGITKSFQKSILNPPPLPQQEKP